MLRHCESMLQCRRFTPDKVPEFGWYGHYEVPMADVTVSGLVLDGHVLERISDAEKTPIVIAAQLSCVRLTIACRQAALAIAATTYRLLVVHVVVAAQPLIVGMAQS